MSRVFGCLEGLLIVASLAASPRGPIPHDIPVTPRGSALSLQSGIGTSQGFQLPPRDNPLTAGTAHIRGRVTAADGGQPLRRVLIRVTAAGQPWNRTTMTDVDGRYDLNDLPAGRYLINVSKSGFVDLSYGQTRPFELGHVFELAANQIAENVDFTLPRAGVITGHVVDEYGEAVPGAQVTPLRSQFMQGQRRFIPFTSRGTTNDIGEFRLVGLSPGQYYVSALLPTSVNASDVSDDGSGYAVTYYPGTPSTTEAQPITVGLAETVTGIDVQLLPVRTARISGTAFDAEGRPLLYGRVMLMQTVSGAFNATPGGPIKPDGTFIVPSVAPGEYVLQAAIDPGAPGSPPRFARATVNVNGRDLSDVILAPEKPSIVSGHVVFDSASTGTLQLPTLRISASPVQSGVMFVPTGPPAQLKEDLSFQLEVSPGKLTIRPVGMTGEWVLKSVRLNGADVTDSGIEFRSGQPVDGIEIEITNRPPEVSGAVTNARGDALTHYTALLFTQDRDLWTTPARGFATAQPDKDGRYKTRVLPPGRYYAAAVEYVDLGNWRDPVFLEGISRDALAFSLQDHELKMLDLRLVTPR
jgi:hypothetical protein